MTENKMSWVDQRRAEFIFARLAEGSVQRCDLCEEFLISEPTASAIFRRFLSVHPGAMVYDLTWKAYLPGPRIAEYTGSAAAE